MMTKMNRNVTTARVLGKELVLTRHYYVAEQLRNGDQIRVSCDFAFEGDATALAREMWKRDHGRGGKFVVITIV